MKNYRFLAIVFLFLFLAGICATQAGTKTWTAAAGTNDWFVDGNWNSGAGLAPVAGDDVVITNAGAFVLLTNSTAYLGSLTLSKTLIFSNWNTKLSATNVTIQSNGYVTLPAAFTNNQMSNNIYFACYNLTVSNGGKINVDGKGWIGQADSMGLGPGGGGADGIGAGHGGYGGRASSSSGLTYGSINAPISPGSSGGGRSGAPGGSGGGAIIIAAESNVIVNGEISAKGGGGVGWGPGGGAGGSIYITCLTISGLNGFISATGGAGANDIGGSGGGGRIAVNYVTNLQAAIPRPQISFQVKSGTYVAGAPGDIGTIYLSDTRFLTEILDWNGQIVIPGFTNWTLNNLTISNGWVRFPQDGFNLTVSNNLIVDGSAAWLQVGAAVFRVMNSTLLFSGGVIPSVLSVGGNLILTNGGCLYMYGATTNSGLPAFGARVSVAGDMYVGINSWVYPQSHPTNGGSVSFQMRNLTIYGTNGGFDANGPRGFSGGIAGHTAGFGPGGSTSGGGSYGGLGGGASGPTYGSSNAPIQPGSGGGSSGSAGGGLVYLQASRTVTLNGILRANGTGNAWGPGAGSGGGIFIYCKTFIGSTTGNLQAKGGDVSWYSPGGGGGRIAVWRVYDQSVGPVGTSVAGGANLGNSGVPGADGTLVWGQLPVPGSIFFGR